MRRSISIVLLVSFVIPILALDIDYRLGGRIGWIMPDGKVDELVDKKGDWIGPAWSVDFSTTFHPNWQTLQDWNNAGIGVGFTYWHLPHTMLGQAYAPYTYLDIPLFKSKHFVLGLRPGIGVGFLTKTYQNTIPDGHLYVDITNSNECIGSVTNIYFPETFYLDFPLAHGWIIGIGGGWYHFSNGSIRQPNSGYNIFAGEVTVKHIPNTSNSPNQLRQPLHATAKNKPKRWEISIGATAGGRQVYYRDQQSFFVGSMHVAAYWLTHPIFRLGGGVDIFYDGAYVQRNSYFKKTNLAAAQSGDCWRIGISIQPEFVVGNFTTGLHIGAYIFDPVKALEPYDEAILSPTGRLNKPMFYTYNLLKAGSAGYPDGWLYTSVVLRYHLPWHIYLQAMMKSHLTKVEFVSLGVGFYY